jgi:hypothetical protein
MPGLVPGIHVFLVMLVEGSCTVDDDTDIGVPLTLSGGEVLVAVSIALGILWTISLSRQVGRPYWTSVPWYQTSCLYFCLVWLLCRYPHRVDHISSVSRIPEGYIWLLAMTEIRRSICAHGEFLLLAGKTWMAGTSPAMTNVMVVQYG